MALFQKLSLTKLFLLLSALPLPSSFSRLPASYLFAVKLLYMQASEMWGCSLEKKLEF